MYIILGIAIIFLSALIVWAAWMCKTQQNLIECHLRICQHEGRMLNGQLKIIDNQEEIIRILEGKQ